VSLAIQMLIGLVAGLGVGVLISVTDLPWLRVLVPVVEPVGTIFVNAVRMTVIPLIMSRLILGVASSTDQRTVRRVGTFGFLLFVLTVLIASSLTALLGQPLMMRLHIDPSVAAALRERAVGSGAAVADAARSLPGVAQWFIDLVPVNAFKAAADGTMLPLIVFSLAFGLALTQIDAAARRAALPVIQAVADSMLTLVRWILRAAPIGVFALAVPLAARLGVAAAGALLYYVALVGAGCLLFSIAVLYPAATLLGGVPFSAFARAAAPAQAIAFSSRSSLASLPVMIETARSRLHLREDVVSVFLPLAAAMFRAGSAIGLTIGALFVARLYGVELGPSALLSIVLTVVVTTLGSPGVPSGSILVIVPILAAANLPVEGFGVLLGVDTIPDMFRTTTNITADMAAVTVVARRVSTETAVPSSG
jgi:proton glutamate symport protein